ncbi:choice-of-anchor tandem repeat GloVer-containing protein [Rhodanobacter sp. C06]|uniref:choice-of-anchor tandem repeat GloVer-containing protein n=1 Tax=Rhodanobacter sp. C06 TaxID=1945854 RepID=UPI0014398D71|nr:choice-of-anchor tandem repeat GloVer-containing protein [Rhodanobacter sp. C06]
MFYRRPTGFARSKATAFCSVRRLAMVMAVLLAGSGQAQAAASHYSLFAQFPPANGAGTAMRGPQVIILGSDGLIYGMSTAGGYYGVGGFFSVRPNGIADSQIDYGSTADSSIGGMLPPSLPANNFTPFALMPNGSILSVTNTGGYYGSAFGTPSGVLYAYMGNGAYGKFHTFYRSTGEVTQPQSIAVGSDGSAYGLALGGTWSGGTLTSNSNLFRFAPVSWNGVVTNLFSFQDYSPTNFVLGTNDNMYVTLPKGVLLPGASTRSTGDVVYKVTKDGAGSVVHVLDPATEGQGIDELVGDGQGNLYGAALTGGGLGNGDGTVFKIDATGGFSVLHRFSSFVGASQQGFWPNSLVAGSDGNVYGMTRLGGAPSAPNGTFFRITPSGVYSVLHVFGDSQVEGGNARSLIQAGPRSFYGVVDGGPTSSGAIFKLVVPIQDDVYGVGESSLLMSGPGALSVGTTANIGAPIPIANGYYLAAVGDLDGDGIADLVWTSQNHDLYVWFGGVNGFQPRYAGTYPSGWTLVGAGDINGDGKDDLIWMNDQTHQMAYWLMDGANRIGSRIFDITPGYHPVALGDFDGNGKLDIMWTSAKNDLYVWLGDGAGFSSRYITTYPAGWRISGRGDLDGDGRDDLIWSTADNKHWGYWLMNGASITKSVSFAVPAELNGYAIAATSDYNGDGLADLVWTNGLNAVSWSNQGQCSAIASCTFSAGTTLQVPFNQTIFNSGIPRASQ